MRIQFKLILVGFVVIAVLMAVVGFIGIRSNQEVAEKFDEIADGTAPALLALGKIESSVHRVNVEATNYALINAELALTEEGAAAAAELEEFLEAKEELERWEDAYAKVAEDEEEQQFVKDIEDAEMALFNAAQKLIDMKNDGIQGVAILEQRDRVGDAEEEFEEVIKKAIAVEKAELEEQDKAADAAAAAAAGRILTVGVIASALLALGIGVFVSRSVAKPLKELQDVAEAVAKGDFGKRAEARGNDEIARVATAFNKMTEFLLEARRLPENILRSMKDSLFVVDTKGNITEVNQAALETLGYKKEELVGKPISKVFGKIRGAKAKEKQKRAKPILYVPAQKQEEDE